MQAWQARDVEIQEELDQIKKLLEETASFDSIRASVIFKILARMGNMVSGVGLTTYPLVATEVVDKVEKFSRGPEETAAMFAQLLIWLMSTLTNRYSIELEMARRRDPKRYLHANSPTDSVN
ncbi:MAG TPA: hypothetical protein VGC58_00565 [Candidatus Paceibacterota bacterium]